MYLSFIDNKCMLNYLPPDVKKFIVGLIIDKFINNNNKNNENDNNFNNNKIKRLSEIMEITKNFNSLVFNNINFWNHLWIRYISKKLPTNNLKELREHFIFAMNLYEGNVTKEELKIKYDEYSNKKDNIKIENIKIENYLDENSVGYDPKISIFQIMGELMTYFKYDMMLKQLYINNKLILKINNSKHQVVKFPTKAYMEQTKLNEIKNISEILDY